MQLFFTESPREKRSEALGSRNEALRIFDDLPLQLYQLI
jgi:hypothetical protein